MTEVLVTVDQARVVVVGETLGTQVKVEGISQNPVIVNKTETSTIEINHGVPGPRGPSGESVGFEFTCSSPLATWIIPIPSEFIRRPSVSLYDIFGEQVEADVVVGSSIVTVTFPAPFAGTAVLN